MTIFYFLISVSLLSATTFGNQLTANVKGNASMKSMTIKPITVPMQKQLAEESLVEISLKDSAIKNPIFYFKTFMPKKWKVILPTNLKPRLAELKKSQLLEIAVLGPMTKKITKKIDTYTLYSIGLLDLSKKSSEHLEEFINTFTKEPGISEVKILHDLVKPVSGFDDSRFVVLQFNSSGEKNIMHIALWRSQKVSILYKGVTRVSDYANEGPFLFMGMVGFSFLNKDLVNAEADRITLN